MIGPISAVDSRREGRLRKLIRNRISNRYAARESLRRLIAETVRDMRLAGVGERKARHAFRELAEHCVLEAGAEKRSLLTGRTDREVVLAEIDGWVGEWLKSERDASGWTPMRGKADPRVGGG